jgi:hypothetical protein
MAVSSSSFSADAKTAAAVAGEGAHRSSIADAIIILALAQGTKKNLP